MKILKFDIDIRFYFKMFSKAAVEKRSHIHELEIAFRDIDNTLEIEFNDVEKPSHIHELEIAFRDIDNTLEIEFKDVEKRSHIHELEIAFRDIDNTLEIAFKDVEKPSHIDELEIAFRDIDKQSVMGRSFGKLKTSSSEYRKYYENLITHCKICNLPMKRSQVYYHIRSVHKNVRTKKNTYKDLV